MMPGMLTADQLAQLDRARGKEFDRLFLTFMIQHHKGAITMVNALFGTGAGEQEKVFRFASDVFADQSTEIAACRRCSPRCCSRGAVNDALIVSASSEDQRHDLARRSIAGRHHWIVLPRCLRVLRRREHVDVAPNPDPGSACARAS